MNSPNQESPMQYLPRLKLSPSDIKFHAWAGQSNSELYAIFISEKEVDALLQAARADAFSKAAAWVRAKLQVQHCPPAMALHPAAIAAYEEAIRAIETWDMPRSSVMKAKQAREGCLVHRSKR